FELVPIFSPSFRIQAGVGYKHYLSSDHDDPLINYDTSYRRWSAFLAPRFDPKKWLTIIPKITYGPKIFLSDLPFDLNHFDRRDSSWTEELSCTADLSRRIELHFKYQRSNTYSKRSLEDLEFPQSSDDRFSTGLFYEF